MFDLVILISIRVWRGLIMMLMLFYHSYFCCFFLFLLVFCFLLLIAATDLHRLISIWLHVPVAHLLYICFSIYLCLCSLWKSYIFSFETPIKINVEWICSTPNIKGIELAFVQYKMCMFTDEILIILSSPTYSFQTYIQSSGLTINSSIFKSFNLTHPPALVSQLQSSFPFQR